MHGLCKCIGITFSFYSTPFETLLVCWLLWSIRTTYAIGCHIINKKKKATQTKVCLLAKCNYILCADIDGHFMLFGRIWVFNEISVLIDLHFALGRGQYSIYYIYYLCVYKHIHYLEGLQRGCVDASTITIIIVFQQYKKYALFIILTYFYNICVSVCWACTYVISFAIYIDCLSFFCTDMHGNKVLLRDVLSFGNIGTFLLQMIRGDIFNNDYCKASNKYIFRVYYKCDDEAIAS